MKKLIFFIIILFIFNLDNYDLKNIDWENVKYFISYILFILNENLFDNIYQKSLEKIEVCELKIEKEYSNNYIYYTLLFLGITTAIYFYITHSTDFNLIDQANNNTIETLLSIKRDLMNNYRENEELLNKIEEILEKNNELILFNSDN
jgi:hypothetical protein